LSRLTNAKLDRHFSGEETYYFAGNGSFEAEESLILIDIDCHATGTLAGAIAFAEFIRTHHFRNLYFEISTNGNGVHAYVRLKKWRTSAGLVNEYLKDRLQPHLRRLLAETGFEVENVEVKATCPLMTWGQGKGELLTYRSGQLAKLPREWNRFNELKRTTVLKLSDLRQLPIDGPDRSRPVRAGDRTDCNGRSTIAAESIDGRHFPAKELKELSGRYLRVATSLLQGRTLPTSGRSVVRAEDLAVFLMLLKFFSGNMNADGSLPMARFRSMWNALFESRDVSRSFDPKRFAAMRNLVSDLGLLEWEDQRYTPGALGSKGQSCCWHASDALMALLEENAKKPMKKEEKTEREEGGTSLRGTQFLINRSCRFAEAIRPVLTIDLSRQTYHPDQMTALVGVYAAA